MTMTLLCHGMLLITVRTNSVCTPSMCTPPITPMNLEISKNKNPTFYELTCVHVSNSLLHFYLALFVKLFRFERKINYKKKI